MIKILYLGIFLAFATSVFAQSADDLLQAAREALRKQKKDEAVDLVSKAIQKNPKSLDALALRASIYEGIDQYRKAAFDWTRVIELDKDLAQAYQQRGVVHFKGGKIEASIADFDKFIELKPEEKIKHWQRGISYYYAGRYDDGRKQFEGYQDFDSNDVENAVWRFMCMARASNLDKARKAILKIGDDRRVPMRQVYDLFKGDLKPDDVMVAARAGKSNAAQQNSQLFYAHLYVGIYQDLLGDKKKAFEHLDQATEKHRIGHYMWDVARIHRDLLAKEIK